MTDIVYRNYSQTELDRQYDQRSLVPDLAPYQKVWREGTDRARATLPVVRDISYDPHPAARLDLYGQGDGSAPVVLYYHGGAWRTLDLDHSGFAAPPIVAAGALFIAVDFALLPTEPLAEQVRQARAAVAWARRHAADHGGDPEKLYVAGHSSGGHLVGTLIAGGWHAEVGLPEDAIRGALASSGPYDLEPVRLSARNDFLKLTEAEAKRLSAIDNIPTGYGPPLAVFWGDGEHDEFRRQGRAFADAWRAAGHPVTAAEVPNQNHFDMSTAFADPNLPVLPAILEMIAGG